MLEAILNILMLNRTLENAKKLFSLCSNFAATNPTAFQERFVK